MTSTRHAHGQFLSLMERLGTGLFGRPIRVFNPYELTTKAEMVRVLAPHPRLALATVSCWYQQWSGRGASQGRGHCGVCIPCLVRRVALESAGIEVPPDHFDHDVLRLAMAPGDAGRSLGPYRSLVGFAARLTACPSWRRFLRDFPAAVEARPTSRMLDEEDWFKALFAMMKRFAREVETVLGKSPA
jgi:hypothetical protein